jgi:hypothetical protein
MHLQNQKLVQERAIPALWVPSPYLASRNYVLIMTEVGIVAEILRPAPLTTVFGA